MKQFLFSLLIVLTPLGFGKVVSNDYYDQTFLGEKDLGHYSGPTDNRFSTNSSSEKMTLLDEVFKKKYLNRQLQEEIFRLRDLWVDETYPDISCPNYYLANSYSYIRYLYRLIGISYLFEAMREYRIASYRLGISPSTCSLKWKDTFAQCYPKSHEMKKFLTRIKDRHLMGLEKGRLVKQSKKNIDRWVLALNDQLRSGEFTGLVERRIGHEYSIGKTTSLPRLKRTFDQICREEKKVIKHLCSEVDAHYGFTDAGIFTYLLQRANTVSVINDGGHGRACLKRFSQINSSKEKKIPYLQHLSEDLYRKIKKSDVRYKQGNIFIAGALKEFDDKGLDDFIFVAKKEVVKPKPAPIVVVVPKPIPKPKPLPAIVVAPIPKPRPKPIPKPILIKKVTQFEIARKGLFASDKQKRSVDMKKFKADFEFSEVMSNALKGPLTDFQSRQGLADMKKWDKLGSKIEPVRLIFLKFLIDNKLHTGLYNITAVLGNHFYVVNDIDAIKGPVHTELENNESTNYQWALTIHRTDILKKKLKKKK
ncbi:MAG: hypothetical protein KAG61_05595 [Bacteriovoracaceae bacterium]|nr:hypothetical protein [Bacteriovoracaceae bacterium]